MRHPLILMAAGVSSRMKKAFEGDSTIDPVLLEEANTLPKCMLSVGPNRTRFIDYIVWNAVHAWFQEIILLLHPEDSVTEPHVRQTLIRLDLEVSLHIARQYIPEGRTKPWGTGDAIHQALEQYPLQPGDVFSISNSDNLCSETVFKQALQVRENTIFSYDTESLGIHPDNRSKYGLVLSQNGVMTDMVEKPDLARIAELEKTFSLSVNMNIFTLKYEETRPRFEKLIPHPVRDEKELTDVLKALAQEGNIQCQIIRESLPDLTSKADIPQVHHYLQLHYPQITWNQ